MKIEANTSRKLEDTYIESERDISRTQNKERRIRKIDTHKTEGNSV